MRGDGEGEGFADAGAGDAGYEDCVRGLALRAHAWEGGRRTVAVFDLAAEGARGVGGLCPYAPVRMGRHGVVVVGCAAAASLQECLRAKCMARRAQ